VVSNGLFLVGSDLAVLCGVILFGFSVVVFSIKLAVQMVITTLAEYLKANDMGLIGYRELLDYANKLKAGEL